MRIQKRGMLFEKLLKNTITATLSLKEVTVDRHLPISFVWPSQSSLDRLPAVQGRIDLNGGVPSLRRRTADQDDSAVVNVIYTGCLFGRKPDAWRLALLPFGA